MEKKSYKIQRNLLGRIRNEMDACYRVVCNDIEMYVDKGDENGVMFNMGKKLAYMNVCDFIEGLINDLENEQRREES